LGCEGDARACAAAAGCREGLFRPRRPTLPVRFPSSRGSAPSTPVGLSVGSAAWARSAPTHPHPGSKERSRGCASRRDVAGPRRRAPHHPAQGQIERYRRRVRNRAVRTMYQPGRARCIRNQRPRRIPRRRRPLQRVVGVSRNKPPPVRLVGVHTPHTRQPRQNKGTVTRGHRHRVTTQRRRHTVGNSQTLHRHGITQPPPQPNHRVEAQHPTATAASAHGRSHSWRPPGTGPTVPTGPSAATAC
jgi:hypothetical protein